MSLCRPTADIRTVGLLINDELYTRWPGLASVMQTFPTWLYILYKRRGVQLIESIEETFKNFCFSRRLHSILSIAHMIYTAVFSARLQGSIKRKVYGIERCQVDVRE